MKHIAPILFAFLLLCMLYGCTEPEPTQAALNDEQLFELLFDIENKIELRLDMDETELAKMQADYETYRDKGSKSPIYRMADLYVTITTPEETIYTYFIEEVGVRMKGNTSRTDFYSQEEGIYNIIHLKLSFKETFDEEQYYGAASKVWTDESREQRKNRTFATLEKLDLRWNRCDDGTYLKEYFAYETFRQYGVLAPHTNLASFDWAGIHMGVFTINEPVDDIFLAKNLPQSALGGDLYKVGWGGSDNGSLTNMNSIGIEDEDAGKFYAYDLQTNKKTSNHESLKNLIRNLTSGDVTKESLAQLVDMENFLPYCAVSYLLGNPDDMRNNYNNYYLYFRGDSGKAIFIPYDFDRCLGITAHWNPTGNGMTGDNPFSIKIAATNDAQRNPVILYSVAAGGYYVREYADLLTKIIQDDWFTYRTFADIYEIAKGNYQTLSRPGKTFYNAEHLHLTFDIGRDCALSSNGNIAIGTYLREKFATLQKYLADGDAFDQQTPNIAPVWYIRADVTDWQNDDDFVMKAENGLFTFRFTAEEGIRLKVYNDQTGRWYGTECIEETCTVAYESDRHRNIVLEKGAYRITFDPQTEVITLEKE